MKFRVALGRNYPLPSELVTVPRSTSVGLYWFHPLVLPEFERVVSEGGLRLVDRRLEPNRIPDFENVTVPRASAYVVEAHPQLPVTEAVVTGIHARQPTARILVLAERFADQTAFALLRLGIKGLLTYTETARSLMASLQTVTTGGLGSASTSVASDSASSASGSSCGAAFALWPISAARMIAVS